MDKSIIILVGIPNSGKSTYTRKYIWDKHIPDNTDRVVSLSRDNIRLELFGKRYKPHSNSEKRVTEVFETRFVDFLTNDWTKEIILDNTHCKEGYIDELIRKYGNDYKISIKFLDISLFKAHCRNILRYLKEGYFKWIPIKILNQYYKNYNKINKKKYTKYII